MSQIEVRTSAKHRFEKTVNINGVTLSFNKEGIAQVDEKNASKVLCKNIELVDKSFKIPNDDSEMQATQTALLDEAKQQAEEIISDAKEQAEKIINEAKAAASQIMTNEQVDEKTVAKAELSERTVKELKNMLDIAKVDPKEYKGMNHDQLVDFYLGLMFKTDGDEKTE
jgi:vacuolar-type H+-ATPase subunit H